ncbi:rho type ras-like GTPase [Trichoderma novae-zelandiae]
MPEELAESIDSWRQSVPSRMERADPFGNDGFEERPNTRITFREPLRTVRRPSTRIAMMRSAIPLFRRRDGPNSLGDSLMERPETALGVRDDDEPQAAQTRNPIRGFFALFGRKRKRRSPSVSPAPTVALEAPLTLHFLFVGPPGSGQTSLLFRARFDCFPDSNAINRTCYETYTNVRMYDSQPSLSYVQWDCIFLCFDVKEKASLQTLVQWWVGAANRGFLNQQQNEVLVHLVGMKKDVREQCTDETHRVRGPFDPPDTVPFPTCCVMPHEAAYHAQQIGCHRYLECSAATGEGLDLLLEEAGQEATRRAIEVARTQRMAPARRRLFYRQMPAQG